MKKILLAGLLLSGGAAAAQIPGRSIKQYTTRMGTVLHVGDTISKMERNTNAPLPKLFLTGLCHQALLASKWGL